MKLAVGCDPNATAMKQQIIAYVESLGHECVDFGSDDPIYANTAIKVAEAVAAGEYDRGILFCGTGALLSPVSTQQGESIPSICHAVAISMEGECM